MPMGRQISISKVMLWVVCVAVFLAATRYPGRFVIAAIGVLAALVLVWDLLSTIIQILSGERPAIVLFPNAEPRVLNNSDLWAIADNCPLRVELVSLRNPSRAEPEFPRVMDRTIDGRTYLCVDTEKEIKPLDLWERGPVLIRHNLYGLCLAQPLARPSTRLLDTASIGGTGRSCNDELAAS
jgi:hypothetical protein